MRAQLTHRRQADLELLTRLAPDLAPAPHQEFEFPTNISFRGPRHLDLR
ncbi:MAG: hypothetical protein L0H84_22350 [Pseudonocardia sp.]|nr:hypothetical protein [Pseudonocardia sp.]